MAAEAVTAEAATPSSAPAPASASTTKSSTNGTQLDIWGCNGGANQQLAASNGALQVMGKCLDPPGNATGNGTIVEIWSCDGGANQEFSYTSSGTIVGSQSGKCVTVTVAATRSGPARSAIAPSTGGRRLHRRRPRSSAYDVLSPGRGHDYGDGPTCR